MCTMTAPCLGPLRVLDKMGGHAVLTCMNGHHFILGTPPPPILDRPKKKGGQNKGRGHHNNI